jgi:hypothetical protein
MNKDNNNEKIVKFEDLPDTITPQDYSDWRGIGINRAREIFNSRSFPRLNYGGRLLADKRAVLLFDLGLPKEEIKDVYSNMGKEMARSILAESEECYEGNPKAKNFGIYES